MTKTFLLLCILLSKAWAGPVVLWGPDDTATLLQDNLNFHDNYFQLSGTDDPTVVAKDAPAGSLYVRYDDLNPSLYQKQDDGLTTNWRSISPQVGTPNTLAYYDASGNLNDLTNWDVNSFGGLIETQAIGLTDSGGANSRLLNQRSITISPTANISTDYIYGNLDQVDLTGTFDYNGYTHNETLVTQSGQSDITANTVLDFKRLHLGVGGLSTSQTNRAVKGQIRTGPAHTSVGLTGLESEILMDGFSITGDAIGTRNTVYVGGTAENSYGTTQTVQTAGDVNQTLYGFNQQLLTDVGATTENVTAFNSSHVGDIVQAYNGLSMYTSGAIGGSSTHVNINSVSTAANGEVAFNYYLGGASGANNTGINLNYDAFAVTGGNTGININDQSIASGTSYGLNYTRNGTSGNGVTVINTNLNSASAVTGDLRHISLYSDAPVSNNGNFLTGIQNGDVAGNWSGIAQTFGADAGSGLNFHSDVVNNGAAITGSVFGHSVSLGSDVTVSNIVYGFNLNNQAEADGVEGFVVSNSADLVNGFRGLQIQDSGDSRTKTGIDVNLSGAVTDDAQGVRINVTGLNMATQRAAGLTVEGGFIGSQGAMTPFNSIGVDVGNNLTMTSTVQSGAPLTGTDQIIQLFQSNLIVNDDIATGPFGIDTNMVALNSQVSVDTGKTVPLLRSLLLGTTVPQGSGGTITEHVVLELLGLPSFGGSVSNPTRTGIQDSALVGQNFCDGGTDCWFIRNQDVNAENHLSRLAIGTANKKASSGVKLEIHNGHKKTTQTTAPVATVNANAGTGATCSVSNATDSAGVVTISTGTIGISTGAYCSVAFDAPYGVAPTCTITPAGSTLSTSTYVTSTTNDMTINFAVAGGISSTYLMNYHCEETQ